MNNARRPRMLSNQLYDPTRSCDQREAKNSQFLVSLPSQDSYSCCDWCEKIHLSQLIANFVLWWRHNVNEYDVNSVLSKNKRNVTWIAVQLCNTQQSIVTESVRTCFIAEANDANLEQIGAGLWRILKPPLTAVPNSTWRMTCIIVNWNDKGQHTMQTWGGATLLTSFLYKKTSRLNLSKICRCGLAVHKN